MTEAQRLVRQTRDLAAGLRLTADPQRDQSVVRADADTLEVASRSLPGPNRLGLVLAGGGAKGAYQAGAVGALADLGMSIAAIGGASIGALNGAVLAAAPDLRIGADALSRMWQDVSEIFAESGPDTLPDSWRDSISLADQLSLLAQQVHNPLLRPDFLPNLIREHVDLSLLASGTPLWVTAAPATGLDLITRQLGWLVDVISAKVERQAQWFFVNELPEDQVIPALQASAALPFVFGPRKVGSLRYRDGGLMDNAPVAPLVANCRCNLIIVIHLSLNAGFDRKRFRGADVIEIRPRRSLDPAGPMGSIHGMVDFSPARIGDLIAEGRRDAQEAIHLLRDSTASAHALRQSTREVLEALSELES